MSVESIRTFCRRGHRFLPNYAVYLIVLYSEKLWLVGSKLCITSTPNTALPPFFKPRNVYGSSHLPSQLSASRHNFTTTQLKFGSICETCE